ncbi:MAG: histidine phosphatase family protein [Rubrobacteraceae bacterium]
MDLYLIRHAVAFKRDPVQWPNDANRPLRPDGEEIFGAVARNLADLVPEVEALLSSPYARAWRTAEILADETHWPAPGGFLALEPEVPPGKVFAALGTYEGLNSLALVGHRPSLHALAAYLLTGSEDGLNIGLKKGGAACLRFEGEPEPGAAKLRWLLTPKALLGGGES